MNKNELKIIVTGTTGSGKSHLINLLSVLLSINGFKNVDIDFGQEVRVGDHTVHINDDILKATNKVVFNRLKEETKITLVEMQAPRELINKQ